MGSYMYIKNFSEIPQNQGTGSKPAASTPLVRQSSVYDLTFEELQNNLCGSGKDFGSMNMDEFLKNLWTVEETQALNSSAVVGQGNLQRQSSLTVPCTLSQKTVDEVWKELFKENSEVKDVKPNMQQQQKQPTLGEITLEEFLSRAGVAKEENNEYYGDGSSQPNNNTGSPMGFQQTAQNNLIMGDQISENNNVVPNRYSNLPMNMSGIRHSQQQLSQPPFAKQVDASFTSSMSMTNNTQLATPGTRGGGHSMRPLEARGASVGLVDPLPANQSVYRCGAKMSGAMGSPVGSIGDTSSVSPPSYMLGGVGRGRKNGTMEKAMERRHKRMIKNRESAARSRARKQAYTSELEAEIAKLKETNHELQKKQDEVTEMQKNQVTETTIMPWGSKSQCLRRTLTGPW